MLLQPMLARLQLCDNHQATWSLMVTDVVAMLGAQFGNARLLDVDGVLRVISTFRFAPDYLAIIGPVDMNKNTGSARAARERRVVVIPDLEKEAGYGPFLPAARAAGFRSMVSAPVMDRLGVVGVVSAHFAHPHSPSRLELETLRDYCSRACTHIRDIQKRLSLAS